MLNGFSFILEHQLTFFLLIYYYVNNNNENNKFFFVKKDLPLSSEKTGEDLQAIAHAVNYI